jgi:hypothetical protein
MPTMAILMVMMMAISMLMMMTMAISMLMMMTSYSCPTHRQNRSCHPNQWMVMPTMAIFPLSTSCCLTHRQNRSCRRCHPNQCQCRLNRYGKLQLFGSDGGVYQLEGADNVPPDDQPASSQTASARRRLEPSAVPRSLSLSRKNCPLNTVTPCPEKSVRSTLFVPVPKKCQLNTVCPCPKKVKGSAKMAEFPPCPKQNKQKVDLSPLDRPNTAVAPITTRPCPNNKSVGSTLDSVPAKNVSSQHRNVPTTILVFETQTDNC